MFILYQCPIYSQIICSQTINYEDLSFLNSIKHRDKSGKLIFNDSYKYLQNISLDSISYLSDGLKIKGYIMKPKNINKKSPLVIFNRGGNRDYDNLTSSMIIYNLSYLANNGYVVAGSTYRGNKNSEGKDEFGGKDINGIINLISCLREEPYIDSTRISLYGWSRGGIMTYKTLKELKCSGIIKTAIIGGSPSNLFQTLQERPNI